MLTVEVFQRHVAARLLDFFGSNTLWHRRLWTVGLVLTLREVLEASEAVQASSLSAGTLKTLTSSALSLMGTDPGVGTIQQRRLLDRCLKTEMRFRGLDYDVLGQLVDDIDHHYLERWAIALTGRDHPGVERTARAIAAHMLDSGLSAEFLHHWWTYKINHENGARTLADLMQDAHTLVQQQPRSYRILVAFQAAPSSKSGRPTNWLTPQRVSQWLTEHGFDPSRVRQSGGMEFTIAAQDPWSAVEATAEIVDTFSARVAVSSRDELRPVESVWIHHEPKPFRLKNRRRGLQVRALYREDRLYSDGRDAIIDAAFELLEPLAGGAPGPAVAGGWAAIEALLFMPGDIERGMAGDRLAGIVAASFPRAELTALAYKVAEGADPIGAQINAATTNRDRASVVANAIATGAQLPLTTDSDNAAVMRLGALLADPHSVLRDIQHHASSVFRRLYKNRNLVLHWGKTDAISLRPGLRTAAPLVGAGMDRVAHAWFVSQTPPHELAARATIRLALVGFSSSHGPLDLLEA